MSSGERTAETFASPMRYNTLVAGRERKGGLLESKPTMSEIHRRRIGTRPRDRRCRARRHSGRPPARHGYPDTTPTTPQTPPTPTTPRESSITITLPSPPGKATSKPRPSQKPTPSQTPTTATETDETRPSDPARSRKLQRRARVGPRAADAPPRGSRRRHRTRPIRRARRRPRRREHRRQRRGSRLQRSALPTCGARLRLVAPQRRTRPQQEGHDSPNLPTEHSSRPWLLQRGTCRLRDLPSLPIAAVTTILIGLLVFFGVALVPGQALARIGRGTAPGIRLGIAAAGLSLVLGTLITLLSSS